MLVGEVNEKPQFPLGQFSMTRTKKFDFSASRAEVTKGLWWMPWRQTPMKDVGHCDKPRGAVYRRRSEDVRMGKPAALNKRRHPLNT
jgi:hypothetical protein